MTYSRSEGRQPFPGYVAQSMLAAALALGLSSVDVAAGATAADTLHVTAMAQVPAAVAAGSAPFLAPLPDTRHLKLAINLPLRNTAELDALLQRLQDPRSPDFHHYLGVDEFTARFAPTEADYGRVVDWAKAQGFVVTNTTRNRHIVDIDGSVDVIDRALHVTMGSYRHPAEQRAFFAPDREPTLDLGVAVTQITGLDDFTLPKPRLRRGRTSLIPGPVAQASGSGPGGEFLPSDMRAAYYGNGSLTGAGQTVGIFSFDGYKPDDVQVYFQHTGMTSSVPINDVRVNGFSGLCGDGGSGCDDGEQILDIVNVIGMAPGIDQVIFYEGSSGPDILNQMATDNLAKVLSCSWGSTDMGHVADPIFQEFQAQGQTFANATGDSGSYDAQAWLPPSLNSMILQVGGTDLVTTGGGGPWASETAWPDAGGGFYQPAGYSIPVWQQLAGVITATNGGSTTLRNDPDVSAEANFDNPTVSNGQFETGFGGTSFAAPRWAGFIALANEQSVANGTGPLGFVNPAIYAIGTGANYATAFHDPASGSNGAFHAVAGFDLVTGWGSPDGAGLIGSLSGSTSIPGFVLGAYPALPDMLQDSTTSTTIEVSALNGFADSVDLVVSGLPTGVTAVFGNPSTTTGSTLTFTSTAAAAIGTATVTITGTSGSLTQTTSVRLLVGHPASATVSSSLAFDHLVPLGSTDQLLEIANAADSVPLTYSATAYASSDGSCTGPVSWLTIPANAGTVAGGQSAGADVTAKPSAAGLVPGAYAAEICVTTSDATQPQIVVPVGLTVVPGPAIETIFVSSFETGETGGSSTGVVTFTIDQPVEDDQAGSALDLATGNYHTWNSTDIDNINPYDDGTGLQVYWYNDLVPTAFAHKVGGLVVAGNYAVLQSGATVGPASAFSNSVSPMTSWWPGVDGYIGIAFYNSQTQALNYGYIHMQTMAAQGFPAQVLEYGFDNTGAAITIP